MFPAWRRRITPLPWLKQVFYSAGPGFETRKNPFADFTAFEDPSEVGNPAAGTSCHTLFPIFPLNKLLVEPV
jgi:hypothetical protein